MAANLNVSISLCQQQNCDYNPFVDLQATMIISCHTHRVVLRYSCSTYYRLTLLLFISSYAYSFALQAVQGIVQNGTTGAPQSADLVVVVIGNKEVGRTVTDQNGHFTIKTLLPHAVQGVPSIRVLHAGVTYSRPVRFDSPISITVYETSTSQHHLSEYMDIFQFQTRSPELLEVTELHALKNDSWPSRTVVNPRNVRLSVPPIAQNLSLSITEADGQGARLSFNDMHNAPKALAVPLEPGLTKYVIQYSLPYKGHIAFERRLQYRTAKLFVIVAPGMQVAAGRNLKLRSVEDQTGAQVREVDSLVQDFPLTVQMRGNGILSHAFSPLSPHDNNLILPLRTEPSSPDLAARDAHAQIAATTSHFPGSEQKAAPKPWSVKWALLLCAVLFSIMIILGTSIYARKARDST